MTKHNTDKLIKLNSAADALAKEGPVEKSILEGLTDRQRTIAKLKLRGLSQKLMAEMLDLTPARISQEVAAIREHFISKGSDINQAALVGETVTLYEQVEQEAWRIFYAEDTSKQIKLRTLDTIMSAREKNVKLLMDLGLIRRAAIEHSHGVFVSPAVESLTPQQKEYIVANVVKLTPGLEPEPPEEAEYEEIVDYPEEIEDNIEIENS